MIDFRMKTFLTVCKYMNFTRASEVLHLTQPAVSQHIHYLENLYETPLFIRDKKNLFLTDAGEILKNSLETLESDNNIMKKRMQKVMEGKKILTFGVTMTVGEYAIIPALSNFLKSHPQLEVHICYNNTQTLLSQLREGTIDFAIVEGYFKETLYTTRILQRDPFIGVVAKNHHFSRPISCLRDLIGERLLLREHGSGTRAIFTKTLALHNLSVEDFPHIVEVENIHAIVSLLQEDCGISFLYKAAIKKELENGSLIEIPLKNFQISHDFSFIWNKESLFSQEYEKIFQELKTYFPDV